MLLRTKWEYADGSPKRFPRELQDYVSRQVRLEQSPARWLTGVFELPKEELSDWLRSSGATGGGPVCQWFKRKEGEALVRVAHPFFQVWIGCERLIHDWGDNPESCAVLPDWLQRTSEGALASQGFHTWRHIWWQDDVVADPAAAPRREESRRPRSLGTIRQERPDRHVNGVLELRCRFVGR